MSVISFDDVRRTITDWIIERYQTGLVAEKVILVGTSVRYADYGYFTSVSIYPWAVLCGGTLTLYYEDPELLPKLADFLTNKYAITRPQ
jgi:hypothetical protein